MKAGVNWQLETDPAPLDEALAAIEALEVEDGPSEQVAAAKAAAKQLVENAAAGAQADACFAAELSGSSTPLPSTTIRVRQVAPVPEPEPEPVEEPEDEEPEAAEEETP